MSINVDKKLQKHGIESIKFYYKNIPLVGNIYTTCILLSESKQILARGVCICSVLDSHNKKEARKRSKDRALAAFFNQETTLKINGGDPPTENDILKRLEMGSVKRTFTFKNEAQRNSYIDEAHKLNLQCNFEKPDKVAVFIPYFFPIEMTKQEFNFKSEFKPEATTQEKNILRLNKKEE